MEEIPIEYCAGRRGKNKRPEAALSKQIQKAAAKLGYTLYRNQRGAYQVGGRWIRYGLADSASDFIGYSPTGIFTAVEAKAPGKKATPGQAAFIERVKAHGGIAGVVHNIDELIMLLKVTKL